MEIANEILPLIPEDHLGRIARFLEAQGYKEQAYAITSDPEHRFDLAVAVRCVV